MTNESVISPKELKKLEKKCTRYETSCKKLHKENEDLQQDVEKLKGEQQRKHREYLKQLEEKDKNHAEDIHKLQEKIRSHEELQKRLLETKGDVQQFKDQLAILQNNTYELIDSCQQKDSTIQQLSQVVRQKDCRIGIIQSALQNTDDILKKAIEEIEWFENDILKYKLEVDRVRDLNALLHEENVQMKHEVKQYQVRVVEYKNICRDMERKDEASLEQISKLETQVTQLKVEMYDKDNNSRGISLTFHTYENALRDKDEENMAQKDMIKERDVTIDELKRQIKDLNERMSGFNQHIVEQEEEIQSQRLTMYERDQELDQERSLVTEYSAKYNSAIETMGHISLQWTNCYNEMAVLQQTTIAKDASLVENEREQLRLTTELQVAGQAMKDLELENEQINDEMLKWKKGHSFLQELREKHELLLKRKESELQELKRLVQEENVRVTQMNLEIKRLSDDLSSCQDENVNLHDTVSELRESCDESAMKIHELDMIIEERDETITSQRSEYTSLTEGHIQLLYSHERLSCECENYTRTIRELEDQLKQAQDELHKDKEAYTFCTSFQQYIHASRLNREHEEYISFQTRLPGEDFIETLQKQVLELKDNLAIVTLEASNRQIYVRERNEEIKQLRTQLYGYKERVFELQRLQAESRLSNGD